MAGIGIASDDLINAPGGDPTGKGHDLLDDQYRRRLQRATDAELATAKQFQQGPGQYIGTSQANMGMSQAQQAGLQAAGGSNSALARNAAIYGTARAQEGASAQGAQSVLSERGARDQAYLQALDRQMKYRQMERDDQTRRYLGMEQYDAARQRAKQEEEMADRASDLQYIGGLTSGIGSGMGATMSDEKSKKLLAENNALKEVVKVQAQGSGWTARPAAQTQFVGTPLRYSGDFNMEHDWRNAHPKQAIEADMYGKAAGHDYTSGRPLGQVDQANVQTMRAVDPKVWQYKPGVQQKLGLTPRPQMGPTAQNLEATPIGKNYVYDTPAGKQVDTKQLSLANTGMLGTLQRQIDELKESPRYAPRPFRSMENDESFAGFNMEEDAAGG